MSVARDASHGVAIVSWRKVISNGIFFVHERWGPEGGLMFRMPSEGHCLGFIRSRAEALKGAFLDLQDRAKADHPWVRVERVRP